MPKSENYLFQQKHWLPADLGLANANGLVPGGTIIDGSKVSIHGFKRFALLATTLITGGDRTSGSWKLLASLYDSDGNALFATPQNIITGIDRFTAGVTRRSYVVFGEKTAVISTDTGAGTIGALIEMIRAPIFGIQFHVDDDAAYAGGAASPTAVAINVHLFGQS